MSRRSYTRELKPGAVQLVSERGLSVSQAARDLDIHENIVRKWSNATQDTRMQSTGVTVMARLGRPGLTDDQKTELWRRWHAGGRWHAGEGYSDIGRAIGKFPASIFGVLRLFGGYEPAVDLNRTPF
jgi:transposase